MTTGFSPSNVDANFSDSHEETPCKQERVEKSLHTMVSEVLSTAETPQLQTGFSPPQGIAEDEVVPVLETPIPTYHRLDKDDNETPCVQVSTHDVRSRTSGSRESQRVMLELEADLATARVEAIEAKIKLAKAKSRSGA